MSEELPIEPETPKYREGSEADRLQKRMQDSIRHPALVLVRPKPADPFNPNGSAEADRLNALKKAIEEQKLERAKTPAVVLPADPDDKPVKGAMDGAAMHWTSREEGNLKRMEEGLEYKRKRKAEYSALCQTVFENRRDLLSLAAVASVGAARRANG